MLSSNRMKNVCMYSNCMHAELGRIHGFCIRSGFFLTFPTFWYLNAQQVQARLQRGGAVGQLGTPPQR